MVSNLEDMPRSKKSWIMASSGAMVLSHSIAVAFLKCFENAPSPHAGSRTIPSFFFNASILETMNSGVKTWPKTSMG